jgi:hypothetical protein
MGQDLSSNDWFDIHTYEVQLGKQHLSAVFWQVQRLSNIVYVVCYLTMH